MLAIFLKWKIKCKKVCISSRGSRKISEEPANHPGVGSQEEVFKILGVHDISGFYNESSIRKEELRQSCKILGIPAGNLIIIEHSFFPPSQLPDNPEVKWSRLKVSSIILKYVRHLSATVVISFDQSGVSGHLNHIAVYDGLESLIFKGLLSEDCEVYLLKSVFLFQKYLGFLIVPLLYMCVSFSFASTFHDVKTIWKSMKEHKSQFVWFRKLYIVFSQYVYMNTFIKCQNKRLVQKDM
ncbi:UNVERIFIED_CONTAM: Pigl [Trichonephila clavipes]